MESEYKAEELGFAKAWADLPFDVEVEYLESAAQRAKFEVFVKDGLMVDSVGTPLDTSNSNTGKYIFVMNSQGQIFAGAPRIFEFHHSSFLAGAPVASAGEIDVAHGLLLMNNNDSGHYKPNNDHNDQFFSEMKERGIDASKTREYVKKD